MEFKEGQWVKWEDHESICTSLVKRKNACEREVESLKDEIRRIKAIIAESEQHEVVKVQDVTDCNCKQKAIGEIGPYPNMIIDQWWVCPAHGYKKR